MTPPSHPIALTIAGSDSGGGAGIQADLKTFHAFGVFGTSVVTAVTAQNTHGVSAVQTVDPEVVRAQIDAVAEDLRPAAVKTGMLATAPITSVVAEALGRHHLANYVLDPVMEASSGERLLDATALASLRRGLLPLCTLITPNLYEARSLTGLDLSSPADLGIAARALVEMGAGAALVKGGHLDGDPVDVFWDGTTEHTWRRPRIASRDTHGTGCTLAAAITAGLARGFPLEQAVNDAIRFLVRAIETAPGLGSGSGPLNHFASTS